MGLYSASFGFGSGVCIANLGPFQSYPNLRFGTTGPDVLAPTQKCRLGSPLGKWVVDHRRPLTNRIRVAASTTRWTRVASRISGRHVGGSNGEAFLFDWVYPSILLPVAVDDDG